MDYQFDAVVIGAGVVALFGDGSDDDSDKASATNPLGVKGGGESGTVGALPVMVNAVVDALADYGVRDLRMPMTPQRVWQAIHAGS